MKKKSFHIHARITANNFKRLTVTLIKINKKKKEEAEGN